MEPMLLGGGIHHQQITMVELKGKALALGR